MSQDTGYFSVGSSETARLLTLSDGVFSIAMTILTFNLRIATLPADAPSSALLEELGKAIPSLIALALSFQIIGVFWLAHHRAFSHIQRFDRRLFWLNLLFLMFIAIIPFPTFVLQNHPFQQVAVLFYSLTVVAASLSYALLWRYAGRAGLVNPSLSPAESRVITSRSRLSISIFALSAGVSFLSPEAAVAGWALLPLIQAIWGRYSK